jgi:hypothetical protein
MSAADLYALADRARQASPEGEEQSIILDAAWELLAQHSAGFRTYARTYCPNFDTNAGRFGAALDARAYVSAALMLVPEGMRDEWDLSTLYHVARVSLNLNHGPEESPYYGENVCNCVSMAIADAALRAHASCDERPEGRDRHGLGAKPASTVPAQPGDAQTPSEDTPS